MRDPKPDDDSKKEKTAADICDVCGGYGAVEIGDHHLCERCRVESGSCCPEFGRERTQAADESRQKT